MECARMTMVNCGGQLNVFQIGGDSARDSELAPTVVIKYPFQVWNDAQTGLNTQNNDYGCDTKQGAHISYLFNNTNIHYLDECSQSWREEDLSLVPYFVPQRGHSRGEECDS